jgi:hypothetical protein
VVGADGFEALTEMSENSVSAAVRLAVEESDSCWEARTSQRRGPAWVTHSITVTGDAVGPST